MHIHEIKGQRQKCGIEIAAILAKFEMESGCEIESLEIMRHQSIGEKDIIYFVTLKAVVR